MIPTTGEIFPAAFQGTRTAPLLWRAVRSLSRVFLHGPPGYWRCAPYIQRSNGPPARSLRGRWCLAFIRTAEAASCSSSHSADPSKERLLIIVNKADRSELLELPVEGTALAGCTVFQALAPGDRKCAGNSQWEVGYRRAAGIDDRVSSAVNHSRLRRALA